MRFLLQLGCAALLSVATAAAAAAQDVYDSAPPHIAFVDGSATLERDTGSEPAAAGMPLVVGDRVSTERGRVEILFADGSALDLDELTTIELRDAQVIGLPRGRVLLTVSEGSTNTSTYRIDTAVASVDTFGAGEYRVAANSTAAGYSTELAVLRGSGVLSADRGAMSVRGGERSTVSEGTAPTYPQPFSTARLDAFDQWAAMRREDRRAAVSGQYLPPELRVYGNTLDRNGSWQYDNSYGYVWYPAVAPGWQPYVNGYWASVPAFGWTWIGLDIWSWPTHHFGRWGFHNNRWFWVPGRHWGPAWVSWGSAPGFVSWCPLGIDNRPVFALSASLGRGAGWVVVSRDRFGPHIPVHRFALSARNIPRNVPFVTQARPPIAPRALPRRDAGFAGPRAQATTRAQAPSASRQSGRGSAGVNRAPAPPAVRGNAGPRANPAARAERSTPGDIRTTPRPNGGSIPSRPGSVPGVTVYRGGRRVDDGTNPVYSPSRSPFGPYWSGSSAGRSSGGIAIPRAGAPQGGTLPIYRGRGEPVPPGLVTPNQAAEPPNFRGQVQQRRPIPSVGPSPSIATPSGRAPSRGGGRAVPRGGIRSSGGAPAPPPGAGHAAPANGRSGNSGPRAR